ncbi:unnamed protein product [Darwinula stevensoni]|uniref:Uncharacterized protein n=1 Tax=Darwinula stevensoni TaxID=69355 RepID=A0A7R8X885_9CRUS|nr:unnamed protein product [Darwinula stevensoni]CAG0889829.1 unnamed protein product [Darwinula stevensoni]
MRFEKNKADCHFIYEGIDVNVKGVVNEDLGNLDPLSVTFSFNVPYMKLSSRPHSFKLCYGEKVIPIENFTIFGSPVMFRIEIENDSKVLENSQSIFMSVPPENRKKDTNVEEEGNEDSTSDHQGARCRYGLSNKSHRLHERRERQEEGDDSGGGSLEANPIMDTCVSHWPSLISVHNM